MRQVASDAAPALCYWPNRLAARQMSIFSIIAPTGRIAVVTIIGSAGDDKRNRSVKTPDQAAARVRSRGFQI